MCCCPGQEGCHTWSELWCGWGEDRGVGGVGDGVPGVAIVVKPDPGFLDQDNVSGLVCKVKECLHNVC